MVRCQMCYFHRFYRLSCFLPVAQCDNIGSWPERNVGTTLEFSDLFCCHSVVKGGPSVRCDQNCQNKEIKMTNLIVVVFLCVLGVSGTFKRFMSFARWKVTSQNAQEHNNDVGHLYFFISNNFHAIDENGLNSPH